MTDSDAPEVAPAPDEVRARAAALAEEVDGHRQRYHNLDAPTITDGEYDALIGELRDIEDQYPELRTPDSPTQKVGGEVSSLFTAVEHGERMMSLDNAFSPEDLASWAERLGRDGVAEAEYLCELKVDGVAINLTYENGRLTR